MTPLVVLALAWVSGVLLSQAFVFPQVWLLLPPIVATVVALGWGHSRWGRRGALMLVALSLGAVRMDLAQTRVAPGVLAEHTGQRDVVLTGVVDAEPDTCGRATCLRVRVEEMTLPGADPEAASDRLLVTAPLYTPATYGDRVRFTGTLVAPPSGKERPGSPARAYRNYLARQGIHVLTSTEDLAILSSHHGHPVLRILLRLKMRAHGIVQAFLPEPQGALLAGILLGIERDLPPDLVEAFRITGTSHIIAISGMNLALIAGLVNRWARYILKRRGSLAVSLGVVWGYVVLVGASPSVLRAGVMSSIAMIGLHEQRLVHGPTALAAAVLVLSALDPFTFWDLGFQLSFAATVGLMAFVPLLGGWVRRQLERRLGTARATQIVALLWETVIVTLAVEIATLGITVWVSGELPLVALLANSLILPAQPFVMLFGGLALLFGFVLRPLGVLFAWLAWAFLWYTITVVTWMATFPWATVELGAITPWLVWAYYGLLALGMGWVALAQDVKARLLGVVKALDLRIAAAGVAGLVLVGAFVATRPDGKLHVAFLDVGHGDAVLLQTPTGAHILIDGGPDPRQTLAQVGQHMPFWDRALDLVILTSPDESRLAGLVPVLARYEVAAVAVGAEPGAGPTWDAWQDALATRDGPVALLTAGDALDLDGGVRLDVLWPPPGVEGPLVLRLAHGGVRVLLMGDATAFVEDQLVALHPQALGANVLQLARQGNQTSTSVALLRTVAPAVAVVSRGDRFPLSGYVAARLLDTPLYRTDTDGAITILSDGHEIVVKTAR